MLKTLTALVLGTGGGADHVYRGLCSSSLLLLLEDSPVLLVDLGLGVTRSLIEHGHDLPDTLAITHNHTDHAGELPVVLQVERAMGRRPRVLAETEVGRRLQQHRLAEHAEHTAPKDLADWHLADAGVPLDVGHGLNLRFFVGHHSERSCGLLLADGGRPVFGYTGDSGVHPDLYNNLAKAPVVVFDGRANGNAWHAGFDDLRPWLGDGRWVIGHGIADPSASSLPLLAPGQVLTLGDLP